MRVHEVERLAKDFAVGSDQGVHAHGEGVGVFLGDGAGLAIRVDLNQFARAQTIVGDFFGVAGDGLELDAQLAQQFRPTRRGRGQN